jgi:hypothetical protein
VSFTTLQHTILLFIIPMKYINFFKSPYIAKWAFEKVEAVLPLTPIHGWSEASAAHTYLDTSAQT